MPIFDEDITNQPEIFQIIAKIKQNYPYAYTTLFTALNFSMSEAVAPSIKRIAQIQYLVPRYFNFEPSSFAASNTVEWQIKSKVKFLLQQLNGVLTAENINLVARDGTTTPLMYAIETNSKSTSYGLELCRLLIEKGAHLESKDAEGRSLLQIALDRKDVEICKLLILKGAQFEEQDEAGKNILHKAIEANLSEIVELLISRGAKLEAVDKQGRTPLHHAVIANNDEILKLLIENKANIEAVDLSGMMPLHYACLTPSPMMSYSKSSIDFAEMSQYIDTSAAEILILRGADLFAEAMSVEHKNKTALELLLNSGYFIGGSTTDALSDHWIKKLFSICFRIIRETRCLKRSLKSAADKTYLDVLLNRICGEAHYMLPIRAVDTIYISVLTMIDGGFPLELKKKGNYITFYDKKVTRERHGDRLYNAYKLFNLVCDVSVKPPDFSFMQSLLHLIHGGASLNQKDENGNTPLHLACKQLNVHCVKALLETISDINFHAKGLRILVNTNFEKPNKTPLDEIVSIIADLEAKIAPSNHAQKAKAYKTKRSKTEADKTAFVEDYRKAKMIRAMLMNAIQPHIDRFAFQLLQYKIPNKPFTPFDVTWIIANNFGNAFTELEPIQRFAMSEQGRTLIRQGFDKAFKSGAIISAVCRVLEETLQVKNQFKFYAEIINLKACFTSRSPEYEFLAKNPHLRQEYYAMQENVRKYRLCSEVSKSETLHPTVLFSFAKANNIPLKLKPELFVTKEGNPVLKSSLTLQETLSGAMVTGPTQALKPYLVPLYSRDSVATTGSLSIIISSRGSKKEKNEKKEDTKKR